MNEAREAPVLEVLREQSACKLVRVPNYEAVPCLVPGDHRISVWILQHLKSLGQDWRWPNLMQALHWPWAHNLHNLIILHHFIFNRHQLLHG